MALHLDDKWVWDFWFAQDGPDTHIFYLQADRALGDPEKRHWNVSIGHAVSQDLHNWTILPDALRPSTEADAWDNYTTWTGSVIQHEGVWYLFYTGTTRAEAGLVQRVGLATSPDLMTWTKHPNNPLMEVDTRWYELLDRTVWHDQAWRDPYVMRAPETGVFHAFITARRKDGPPDARGVVAHATSTNLVDWDIHEPLEAPADFGHMEVPQVVEIGGRWYLLFSSPFETQAKARQARVDKRESGTHYFVADSMPGPYRHASDDYVLGDAVGRYYSGKLHRNADGQWQMFAFLSHRPDGSFVGDVSDPMPVEVLDDGRLRVQRPG